MLCFFSQGLTRINVLTSLNLHFLIYKMMTEVPTFRVVVRIKSGNVYKTFNTEPGTWKTFPATFVTRFPEAKPCGRCMSSPRISKIQKKQISQ